MKFDEILTKIGEFGTYQKRVYTLLSFPSISVGSFCMMLIVILYTPEHRCKIPSLSNDSFAVQGLYHEQLINETIPPSDDPTIPYDRCHIYITEGSSFNPANASRKQCTEWVYDKSVFTNTFTSQINLVCEDSLKTSHVMMFFYFGLLVGDFILGMLSDSLGRQKSMCIALLVLLASSVSVSFTPEFYSFAVLQFIIGGSGHGAFVAIAVISMEMVGPAKRLWTGMLIQVFFAIGVCYVALTGFLARSWMWINLASAIPCAFYLSFWWFVPESPRWLISKGREDEAIRVIRKTAKVNKTHVPEHMYDVRDDEAPPEGKLWHVFSSPVLLKRTLILSFNWMIISMTYYGVTMNSGNMGGSFFLNFFLMGLAEIPGVFIGMAIIDRMGRRWSNAGTMVVGGIACIATIPTVLLGGDDLQPLTILA
ncbi:organic cation transporter protein-like [Mercenaria mercenaria]|uniref:organic cation transporter protein-like n=1 Tax=Mercenaria mercenaria TaxID=6596 RepID=UPI00234EB6D8|nr:organic cation transporter protein-like [Mercenaria mercenaria]